MIFVTLGTQKQQFTRLLQYIENENIKDEIIVQNGKTKFKSKKMKLVDFISYQEMIEYINQADIIISHGGISVIDAVKLGKKVICCPRNKENKEHINNHQYEMTNFLEKNKYILACRNEKEFKNCIKNIKKFSSRKWNYNKENLTNKLENIIDEYIK